MRIIESRKPKKEKEVICNNCKSKLGYVKQDVIVNDENWERTGVETSIRTIVKYIKCPICHNHIVLEKKVDEF